MESTADILLIETRKIKRVALFVGYSCNNDCRFCVVADKRDYPDKTTQDIKRELEEAYANGAKEVVFTGGECTLRKDIFEIVKFAKTIGYLSIQIQTNGRSFSSLDFCKKILLAGMTEFSPALHGHTPELHDFLTRSKGAYRQTVLGIHNISKLTRRRILILTNTVITKYNYSFLPQIARLLIKLGVHQYQFAFVHALGNANKFFQEIVPKKTDAAPYIKEGLSLGIKNGVRVMAEAIPLCILAEYKKYASEFYMPFIEVKERGMTMDNFAIKRKEGKLKFSQCARCCYDSVCEGPWKEYAEHYGDSEFQPVGEWGS